jgi:hypothetical protein
MIYVLSPSVKCLRLLRKHDCNFLMVLDPWSVLFPEHSIKTLLLIARKQDLVIPAVWLLWGR